MAPPTVAASYLEKLLHVHQAEDAFEPTPEDADEDVDGC
jgi:hypothetical protein